MSKFHERALVLIAQSRFDLAENELRQALAGDPDDALAHALLAQCLCEREQYDEATREAQMAIHLAPELDFAHFMLARVLHERDRYDEAEQAIREALRLDPEDPDYYSRLAAIRYDRREWGPALEAAEEGLAHDAEHVGCNNLRAMALVKLGRKDEAGATIAEALARDPENAFSHANLGWTLLHQGERQKALEHFREALRLDPTLDFARAGIVEALKSRNIIYALLLRYFLWMASLSHRAQWAVIIGGLIGYRVLRNVAAQNPALAPWVWPVLVLYLVFAVLTWIAYPLFNLLLRLDKFGKYALSREQIVAANWVGAMFFPALACLLWWLVTSNGLALIGAVYFGLLIIPVTGVFQCNAGWPRRLMALYAVGLAVVGLAGGLLFALGHQDEGGTAVGAFLLGGFLAQFVANGLGMVTPKR